jgi:hypothetical protein
MRLKQRRRLELSDPREERLFVPENNSPDIAFVVRDKATGEILPLAAADDLEFYIKPDASTPDDDLLVTLLTRDAGDFTFPDDTKMSGSVNIPETELSESGIFFYKLDVIKGGKRRTEKYGPLVIVNV